MKKKRTMIWGFHPVSEALLANRRLFNKLYLVQDKRGRREKIAQLADAANIEIDWVSAAQLNEIMGHERHQGVAAITNGYPYVSLDQIIAIHPQAPFLLALDQVVDPHNLGAMARTALCAGMHGMILLKDRAAAPTASASKASAGALEHLAVARVTNMVQALKGLKTQGLWIAGADRHGDTNLYDADLSGPLVLVVGGEEKGLRPLVRQECDFVMAIPQVGTLGSLNASVAAAVIIYESFRQRRE